MHHYLRRLCALLILCLSVTSAQADVYVNEEPPADWQERDLFRITQFVLGAGDGMLLEVNGQTMLIDGGTNEYTDYLEAQLADLQISHVDYLFNTHPHADHIRCQYHLVRRGLTAGEYLYAFRPDYNNKYHKQMLTLVGEKNIPARQVGDGDTMTLGAAQLTFLQAPTGDLNSRSCMLHIRYGEATLLLTADVIGQAQHHFYQNVAPELLDVQVFKVPHHGTMPIVGAFLKAVTPEFAFVTNRSSVTQDSSNQLKQMGASCLYSTQGIIVMETDGVDWYIRQDKNK